jgi:VIT1/CCC1 family predicted Fe2+/Mn2+ transporter
MGNGPRHHYANNPHHPEHFENGVNEFILISLGIGFVTAAIPPIADSAILPLGRPLHGVVMSLGAGLAAFLVTAALSGRAGVADLGRRSLRWRVQVSWYLITLLSVPIGQH